MARASSRPKGAATTIPAEPAASPPTPPVEASALSDEWDDAALREHWSQLAREIERLNQTAPHAGVARAEAWLAEEAGGEGRARALRAAAYALRVAGLYDRAEPRFTEAEQAFGALGLHDDAARTRIGHVEALRYLGRYDEG